MSAAVPAQLLADVSDFTGRSAHVARLGQALTRPVGRAVPICVISGVGGAGKTTLATHVGHAIREQFPDGQLYADLQGVSATSADPEEVLATFLLSLGIPDSDLPLGLAERSKLFRTVAADKRLLVVLDNAADSEQVLPLLPGTASCAVIVTSRAQCTDLYTAHRVRLDMLEPEEAHEFLVGLLGRDAVESDPAVAADLLEACGYLPLAVRIVAARLRTRPSWRIGHLTARLRAAGTRLLSELRAGDLGVRSSFQLSYDLLEPQQQWAFRLLAVPDILGFSAETAAAVLGIDPFDAEDLLESFVDLSLLESPSAGRYRFHDLVRCFGSDAASEAERTEALARLIDYFLATLRNGWRIEQPHSLHPGTLPPTTHPGLSFDRERSAVSWAATELSCVMSAAVQAARNADLPSIQIAHLLRAAQRCRANLGIWPDLRTATGILLARGSLEPGVEVLVRDYHAQALITSRLFDDADLQLGKGIDLCANTGDVELGHLLHLRGILRSHQGRLEASLDLYDEAVKVFEEHDDVHAVMTVTLNKASSLLRIGFSEEALDYCARVIEKAELYEDGPSKTIALRLRAVILERLARIDEAMVANDECVQLAERYGLPAQHHRALRFKAGILYDQKRFSESVEVAHRAAELAQQANALSDYAEACSLLARALDATGDTDKARPHAEEAERITSMLSLT